VVISQKRKNRVMSVLIRQRDQIRERMRAAREKWRRALQEQEPVKIRNHPADNAPTTDSLVEVSAKIIQYYEERLMAIEESIIRLQQNSYGTCSCCGKPISAARLRIMPGATRCVGCQKNMEPHRIRVSSIV